MGDEMDRVQGINEDFQKFALDQNQRSREPDIYTGINCIDCGEEIPEARRKASPGCRRCIGCQQEFESITKHWRTL